MKHDRRQFIQQAAGSLGALGIGGWLDSTTKQSLLEEIGHTLLDNPGPGDEDFWALIRQAYTVSPQIINLNNGGVSPQPAVVQDAMVRFYHQANEGPSYYMWQVLDQGREPLRRRLAELAGCDPEEVAMNRNASEALETAIYGIPLEKGDEVVLSKQDYPNMINAWKQREQREGIVLKWVNHQLPTEDTDILVRGYTDLFSSRTRVVHITHIINWNGQVLPAREISRKAKERNILVVIDGAHSFAHLDYTVPDLGGDYFGTSLHKWLSAPFGSGFLWVRKDRIAKTWPLFASQEPLSGDIRKFEALGTRSFPIEHAVGEAIDFQRLIGNRRKQERLWYLKNYWTSQVLDLPGVSIGTPVSADWSGAIALLQIEGKEPSEISQALWKDYKIHTVAIVWENIRGVRITPHVYTSLRDLDLLVKAIRQITST